MSKKLLRARPEIEFISYNGRYPNLCSGTLVIKKNFSHLWTTSLLLSMTMLSTAAAEVAYDRT